MRIAIVSWSRRKAGGAETYLETVIPALTSAGNEVAYFCEVDRPADREPIDLPAGTPQWCVEQGSEEALDGIREWRPDLVYAHGLADPSIEDLVVAGRRTVGFAHNYSGCCASGTKTFAFPQTRACERRLGWGCLLNYYPRRCGGLNPATAWESYRRETRRLQVIRGYSAIVTGTAHMRREYIRQGFDERRVRLIPYPLTGLDEGPPPVRAIRDDGELRILFAGRMVNLKGGDYLIRALSAASAALRRSLRLTMAGDGPARSAWELQAARLRERHASLSIEFRGWLSGAAYQAVLADAHLIAIPSLWQEPFGLSGLEAARQGIPAVAFAVGGIPEWCVDGVNGHLAPGAPPTATGLAEAIVKCLADSSHYVRLSDGARSRVHEFTLSGHIKKLTALFAEVAE
jgi:glycosyltransferase involved in cell wall biosynthesis